jgi:hypothetical protein
MTIAADLDNSRSGGLIPALFFLAPLVTTAVPRLTPGLFVLIGCALIVASLRQGFGWRQLLQPCLLLSLCVFMNATWALDPSVTLGSCSGRLLFSVGTTERHEFGFWPR